MKKAPMILFAVLAFAVLTGEVWGAGVSLTFKAGQFWPSDSVFKEVYKSGMVFGGELAVPIAGDLHFGPARSISARAVY